MNRKKKKILRNLDVRAAIEASELRYWWVAEELGVACGTFSNWLRRELPPEEKRKILAAVQRLSDRQESQPPETFRQEMTLEARATIPSRSW